ncbi:MAG: hypothetical protein IKJ74_01135 [Clostridia bacterium]|nr:hypothetical protein [Clostridia bacterium]
MNIENKNKKRASYESPAIQMISFETEDVMTISNGGFGGFWGEEDSFSSNQSKTLAGEDSSSIRIFES